MELFRYLPTDCYLEPRKFYLNLFNEYNEHIEQIFEPNNEYLSLFKTLMRNIQNLLNIDTKNNKKCYTLKEICRFQIRTYMRNQQYVLVQVEKQLRSNDTVRIRTVFGPYIWRRNADRNIIKIDPYTASYYGAQKWYHNMGRIL
jgi:hypothetical protein